MTGLSHLQSIRRDLLQATKPIYKVVYLNGITKLLVGRDLQIRFSRYIRPTRGVFFLFFLLQLGSYASKVPSHPASRSCLPLGGWTGSRGNQYLVVKLVTFPCQKKTVVVLGITVQGCTEMSCCQPREMPSNRRLTAWAMHRCSVRNGFRCQDCRLHPRFERQRLPEIGAATCTAIESHQVCLQSFESPLSSFLLWNVGFCLKLLNSRTNGTNYT